MGGHGLNQRRSIRQRSEDRSTETRSLAEPADHDDQHRSGTPSLTYIPFKWIAQLTCVLGKRRRQLSSDVKLRHQPPFRPCHGTLLQFNSGRNPARVVK